MRVEVIEIQIPFEIKKDLEIRKVFLFSNLNWAKNRDPAQPAPSFLPLTVFAQSSAAAQLTPFHCASRSLEWAHHPG
jgi:hypothetical protein